MPIQECVKGTGEGDLFSLGAHVDDMLSAGVGELVALFESDKPTDNKKGNVLFKNYVSDHAQFLTEALGYVLNYNDTGFNHLLYLHLGRANLGLSRTADN
eukprot:8724122-Pyramimonas_sp.AAC.1